MEYFESFGLFGVFISAFLAATILPLSSEVVLSTYLLTGQHQVMAISLATVGNTLGGMTNYYIGHLGKLEWSERFLKISHESIVKYKEKVESFGAFIALFTWLPAVGDPLALTLGYFKVKMRKVVVFMFIGKALRYLFIFFIAEKLQLLFKG